MKNLKKIADLTETAISSERSTWIPLYYSFKADSVYDSPGDGRLFVTNLINPNSTADIESVVALWKAM